MCHLVLILSLKEKKTLTLSRNKPKPNYSNIVNAIELNFSLFILMNDYDMVFLANSGFMPQYPYPGK